MNILINATRDIFKNTKNEHVEIKRNKNRRKSKRKRVSISNIYIVAGRT